MTEVIHIQEAYKRDKDWPRNPAFVYVGRAKKGLSGEFGNQFVIGRDGTRPEVVAKHRIYLGARMRADPEFARKVRDMKDKAIVCFCKPLLCHGDNYAEAADFPERFLEDNVTTTGTPEKKGE